MPAKSKKDKRKKKGRLTNEDILKLIKKLKPKNQQTVRINIGDKEDKKKGAVSNQPPVRSEVSYFHAPPKTEYFQPPQQPLPIHKPAPSLAETKASFQAPSQPEKQEVFVPRRTKERKLKRLELQPEEYEYFTQEPAEKTTFNAPEKFRKSILSASSKVPTSFYEPVQNDRYQPALIQTTQLQDQIGNRSSFNMSSNTWTLTPEGDVQSIEDIQKATQQEPPSAEAQPTEEELIQQQTELLTQPQSDIEAESEALIVSAQKEATRQATFKKVFNPYESSSESDVLSRMGAPNMTIFDVNRLIREGQISMDEFNLGPKAIYASGQKKGQLRKEITSRELYPILQAIDKRGLELKKTVSKSDLPPKASPTLTPIPREGSALFL